MADTKISGMTAATALTGAEVLPVVQSAANVKATTQQVVDAAMTTGLTRQALGSINTNTTIDWSVGSYVTATIGGALTFTFSNPAPTGNACVAYLQLTNGGSAVITWPVSVTWSGGTAPTLRASGVDLLRFYTQDNGTTWFGTAENDEANVAGSDTQVLFNDGGVLAGDSGFTFNKTNNTLDLGGGTVTASDPVMDLSQTWNGAGVAFTGWKLNVTDTASAAASILGDWQIGGNSRIRFGKNSLSVSGTDQSTTFLKMTHAGGSTATIDYKGLDGNTSRIYTEGAGTWLFDNGSNLGGLYILGATGTRVNSVAYFGWTNSNAYNGTLDLALYRDAAAVLAQRNGTNAQTFRVYNTYTDASNYERGKFEWASNELRIGTEKAGTGSARGLALQVDGVNVVSWNAGTLQATFAYQTNHSANMNFSGLGQLYSHRNRVSAVTNTSYTFTTADCGGTIAIATSASDQTFTTPASMDTGTHIGFKVSASKSSYLRITANTGQKIRLAGGLSASAGYVRSNVAGSFVWLIYDDTDAEWVAWQQGGTWTIDS